MSEILWPLVALVGIGALWSLFWRMSRVAEASALEERLGKVEDATARAEEKAAQAELHVREIKNRPAAVPNRWAR